MTTNEVEPTLPERPHPVHEVRADREGNEFELREISCPTCGPNAAQRTVGVRGGPTHRKGLGIENRIVCCEECGLYFANPFPFPRDPQTLYGDPDKYFASHDMGKKLEANRALMRGAKRAFGREDLSLLDVGSGRGELLAAAKAEGLRRVVGLELSKEMITYAREEFGVEVVDQLLEDYAASTDERFDVIVLNAVLEHVYDPDSMIATCARLLSPRGLLYIDIPNEDHLIARVGGLINRLRDHPEVFVLSPSFPPYHVFGFTRQSLKILLAKHGLRIEHIRLHGSVRMRSARGLRGRAAALAVSALNLTGNLAGMGHNMFVWARLGPKLKA